MRRHFLQGHVNRSHTMHAYQKDVLLYFLLTRHKMYGGAAKPIEGGFQQEADEMFTALPAAS